MNELFTITPSIPTATKCAFCNRPAITRHVPPPINGHAMPSIPICGGKRQIRRVKR